MCSDEDILICGEQHEGCVNPTYHWNTGEKERCIIVNNVSDYSCTIRCGSDQCIGYIIDYDVYLATWSGSWIKVTARDLCIGQYNLRVKCGDRNPLKFIIDWESDGLMDNWIYFEDGKSNQSFDNWHAYPEGGPYRLTTKLLFNEQCTLIGKRQIPEINKWFTVELAYSIDESDNYIVCFYPEVTGQYSDIEPIKLKWAWYNFSRIDTTTGIIDSLCRRFREGHHKVFVNASNRYCSANAVVEFDILQ
jgi:hypothetical protein